MLNSSSIVALAGNVGRIGEEADAQMFIGIQMFKIILDCLQKVNAIKNDNNCVKITAEKFIDKIKPRIEFTIIAV